MIIETCPICGNDLVNLVLPSVPPVNVTRCNTCGWEKSKKEDIIRVSALDDTAADGIENTLNKIKGICTNVDDCANCQLYEPCSMLHCTMKEFVDSLYCALRGFKK